MFDFLYFHELERDKLELSPKSPEIAKHASHSCTRADDASQQQQFSSFCSCQISTQAWYVASTTFPRSC
jgi:hypothetical protein